MITIWDIDTAKKEHQFSPRLAASLIALFPKDQPVIDFGCGKGTYLSELSEAGFECFGIEGTPGIKAIADFENIQEFDLTQKWKSTYKGSVLSLEVAEHIPAEFEQQFLKNITGACQEHLVISWAVKGQGGTGHHNEQNADYVVPTIEKLGFHYYDFISQALRASASQDLWWFGKSIYFFMRKK